MKRLRNFWERHPDAQKPLRTWYKTATNASWESIADVRKTYPHADSVKLHGGLLVTIFNVRGNHYRLACTVDYDYFRIYVKHVMTHAEYTAGRWKVTLCHG